MRRKGEICDTDNSLLYVVSGQDNFVESERVVLVNERDEPLGTEWKIRAHKDGALHRAFSVFVLNASRQLLIQRRSLTKYHSRGLWSNTCCGHPRPGETIETASTRRLKEEMGFEVKLTKLFSFLYQTKLEDGLSEHEYDHVLLGWFEGIPTPDPLEVAEWKWIDIPALMNDLKLQPEIYTYWLRIAVDQFVRAMPAN